MRVHGEQGKWMRQLELRTDGWGRDNRVLLDQELRTVSRQLRIAYSTEITPRVQRCILDDEGLW